LIENDKTPVGVVMNNYDFDNSVSSPFGKALPQVDMRPLMRAVYLWMVFGLLTTAAVSAYVTTSIVAVRQISQWYMPLIILEFVIVLGISWAINRISPVVAGFLFFLYSAINGLVFGVIFYAYIAQGESMAIANAFLTTAGLFGTMTVIGYTTKTDLTKWGSFLMMGVIGLVIASVVNWFLGSSMLDFIISVVGVLIFTGLTAYDTQRIKVMAEQAQYNSDQNTVAKLAIMGALTLYLDFINIFLFLLRLFGGGRRD
jgi:uncharacterized protein